MNSELSCTQSCGPLVDLLCVCARTMTWCAHSSESTCCSMQLSAHRIAPCYDCTVVNSGAEPSARLRSTRATTAPRTMRAAARRARWRRAPSSGRRGATPRRPLQRRRPWPVRVGGPVGSLIPWGTPVAPPGPPPTATRRRRRRGAWLCRPRGRPWRALTCLPTRRAPGAWV